MTERVPGTGRRRPIPRAAAIAAMALVLPSCGPPQTRLEVGVEAVATDVVVGHSTVATTAPVAPATTAVPS